MLKLIIYADSLFLVNFFMDTAIIFSVFILKHRRGSVMRIFFAAALSALYGTLMFFKELAFMYGVIGKIIVSAMTILIAFRTKKLRNFLGLWATFWLVSSGLGGIVLAMSVLTDFGVAVQTAISNCVLYVNLNPILLVSACVMLYILLESYKRMCIRNFSKEKIILPISVRYLGEEYKLITLIDTGCELQEPLSGEPMLVAERGAFKDTFLTGQMVYINTASGKAELPILFPDSIDCENGEYEIGKFVPIALTTESFCDDGLYNSIINPDAVRGISVIENEYKILHKSRCAR